MANLKNIRDRINSINNTQKITRAMKMVAAAKVKKSENRVKAARPFSKELGNMLNKALSTFSEDIVAGDDKESYLDNLPTLLEKREAKSVGLLVVTSNKGLAGAFNANVIRYTIKKIQQYNDEGVVCKLFVIGQKGLSALKHAPKGLDFEIVSSYTKVAQDPTSASATLIAEDLAKSFCEGQIDRIEIVTTRFKNMLSYSVETWQLLPLADQENDSESTGIDTEMVFEPDPSEVLLKIVPLYVANIIFQALLESTASELAARMTAMSAACNNAQEMIRILTIDYNKARQSAITQEINEVVSGADSLK